MDSFGIQLLVALTVALLVWGVWQIVMGIVSNEKKKLQERLSGEGQTQAIDPSQPRVLRRQVDIRGLSGLLTHLPGMTKLGRRLLQTWPDVTLSRFLTVALMLSTFGFMAIGLFTASLLMAAAGAVLGGWAPFILLSTKRSTRQRMLAIQLPEALDFMGRILRAGHSFSTGLQMMSQELPEPLAGEFRRCYDQHSLGQPLEDSLKDTAVRIESTDFGFFVTAVLIQRQTGGDLAEVLDNISDMIRQRVRLQQHVKAKTAEGRFTGYILVGFPMLLFTITYFLNPAYAGVLLHTSTGNWLMGIAMGLMMMGLFAIRKITTVKV